MCIKILSIYFQLYCTPFPHENKGGEIVEKLLKGLNRENQVNLKNTCEYEFKSRSRLLIVICAVALGIIYRNKIQSLLNFQ